MSWEMDNSCYTWAGSWKMKELQEGLQKGWGRQQRSEE